MPKSPPTYTILRDTREQRGWTFPCSTSCLGQQDATLKTGDYTLLGYEKEFVIERKGSLGELVNNLYQKRFYNELARLDEFDFPFLFLEFTYWEVVNFPAGSGIPEKLWSDLKATPQFIMMRLHEMKLQHPKLHIEFVGEFGREAASSLFKRVVEHYGQR